MLEQLPLDVVTRIGQLGRWDWEMFLILSQVSVGYKKTVHALHLFAEKFASRRQEKADVESPETIAHQWFTRWKTKSPQVARRLGSIAHCLSVRDSDNLTDEDVSALGKIHDLELLCCRCIALGNSP